MISVLLIDDEGDLLDMAKRFLEKDGDIQASTAGSWEQAIDLLKEHTFNIIVSDYTMPGMNGIDLLKAMRAQGDNTPVIIYAGQGKDNVTIRAMRNGADFVLHKATDPQSQFSDLRGIIEEIVRRRNAESILHRREQDFHSIVTKNADAMIVLSGEGIVRYVNPAALTLFNMTQENLVGKMFGFPIVLSEPVDMYILRRFKEFVAVEMRMVEVNWDEKPSYLISFRDVTGHVRFEENLSKARDELENRVQERTAELMKINEKLTAEIEAKNAVEEELRVEIEERSTTEEELRIEIEQRAKVEKALEQAKGQSELYLDLMGHDINNLNQIGIGYLELAMQASTMDEVKSLMEKPLEVMKSASDIISNVRKIKQVTEDIDKTVYGDQIVNLCEVLSDLKERYMNAPGRDIAINLTMPRICFIKANDLINDVFSNLVDNSIKHSNPKNPLVIDIKLEVRSEKQKNYVMCTIEDNGPGIPDWLKDRIFARFQRGTTKAHGKGLGLFLVKRLVQDCHGMVWVEDRVPGEYTRGAKFTITFPAVD
ncbi:MAG TPA: ATP-binding protein [Methanocella sp.]|nr:ATP-binding protein [Methanocella sp.]